MTAAAPVPEVPLTRLDHADPALLEELLTTVRAVAEAGAFTLGEHVAAFEADFAAYLGARHAVGVASGTDALTLVLRALGVGPGDEVVVPANSFVATAEAVSLAGATPRFADVDPHTHLVTAANVEAALTPAVRCIVAVHLYGQVADMEPILELGRAEGIPVIEDACQAHGAWAGDRRAGTVGTAGCFSFYPAKNLGAWGDGGAVITDDPALADRVALLRSHGERPRYRHRVVGTTARLDALQAAILRVKLRRLDAANDERRRLARAIEGPLRTAGVDVAGRREGADHVHHLLVVRSDDRDALRAHLAAQGIASGVHYPTPIHRTEAYAHLGYEPGSLPVSEALAQRVCTLPLFPGMADEEVARVIVATIAFAATQATPTLVR